MFLALFYLHHILPIIALEWPLAPFSSSSLIVHCLALLVNATAANVQVYYLTYLLLNLGLVWALFFRILLLQLRQLSRLLSLVKGKIEASGQANVSSRRQLTTFMRYHQPTLAEVFRFNAFFGRLLYLLLILQLPSNSYLLLILYNNNNNNNNDSVSKQGTDFFLSLQSFVLAQLALFQLTTLLVYHLVGALVSQRLHSCARPLHFLLAQPNLQRKSGLQERLRLVTFTERLSVKRSRRYGIALLDISTMSLGSFGRCCVLYGEMIMYWRQLKVFL